MGWTIELDQPAIRDLAKFDQPTARRVLALKSFRIQAVALVLAGLISLPVHADVIPGRWEKVAVLESSSPITVELKNGDRIKGQFQGLSSSDLELLGSAGRAVIPKSDIRTVIFPSEDGLGDGALKGAAIGAAVAFGASLIGLAIRGTGGNADDGVSEGLVGVGVSAGIGAGLGIAVDAATKTEGIVLYRAPENPQHSKRKDVGR